MNESKTTKCPRCGADLPMGLPEQICPRCAAALLQATQTEIAGSEERQRAVTPPAVTELASLFPQLEILELLGRGGMGAVYKARQKELDRLVALKILPPGIGEDPAFAERFAQEAKALAKLNHPGIVTIHDFGRVDGLYYFVMEFVDGVNLHRLLENGRISPREALAIVPQICDALQYAHDQGIVHRDIKPQNLLLDRRGRVKVADFGLAKLMGAEPQTESATSLSTSSAILTEAGRVMGTPAYMAPEQKERPGEVDHRADIYALGVVFYQLLTGELPRKPIEAPSRRVQIDVRLDEIVLKALEKSPDRRYEQAGHLKTAVESISSASGYVRAEIGPKSVGASAGRAQPRWWQVFLAGFLTVVLLEFGALALKDRGLGPLVLALLAGGLAVAVFLIARKTWLNALMVGIVILFFSWLAVVALASTAVWLAGIAAAAGLFVFIFAMRKLGVSRVFFAGFILTALVVFGACAAITFLMPESFVSTARIKIEANSPAASRTGGREFSSIYDPYLLQTEFEVMQSGAVLGKVIQNLRLNEEWSTRYNRGQPLSDIEVLELLKRCIDLRPVRNTSLAELRVFSEKAQEAASIANEIARVYQDHFEHSESAAGNHPRAKVEIVDLAEPGLRPVRPNKPLNLAIGALAGLLLGTAGGTGAARFQSRKEKPNA